MQLLSHPSERERSPRVEPAGFGSRGAGVFPCPGNHLVTRLPPGEPGRVASGLAAGADSGAARPAGGIGRHGAGGGRFALAGPARPRRHLRHDPPRTAAAGYSQESRRREYRPQRRPQGRSHLGLLRRRERRDVRQGQDGATAPPIRKGRWMSTSTTAPFGPTCRWTSGR